MSVPLTVNGVTFNYPVQGDIRWGPVLTAWSTAVTTGMLQKAGGSFPLTAEADFGTSFGINVLSLKSTTLPRATTGFIRMANAQAIAWRNFANSADLPLTVDASNQLTYNGVAIGASAALTNGHIFVGNVSNQPADVAMTGDITIVNTGVTSIGTGVIVNADINASAAIALSKLAPTTAYYWYAANSGGVLSPLGVTASRAVITDANGLPSASSATSTEIGYVSGVTSSIQAQLNALSPTPAGIMADFAGTVAPTGWLLCDGSAISRTTYSTLFSAIGTTWGAGDGSTTFNIPNMSRRVGMGAGGSGTATIGNAVGNVGGEENHVLITAELASHTHTASVTDPGHTHNETVSQAGGGTPGGVQSVSYNGVQISGAQNTGSSGTGISVGNSNTGGGSGHNTIQPSAIVLKIIKY